MLEHILIKQFVNWLSNEVSRERVILNAPKALTKATQFSRLVGLRKAQSVLNETLYRRVYTNYGVTPRL